MRLLLFQDTRAAEKFLRRHRDEVLQVIVVVAEDGGEKNGAWKGAVKTNYNAVVLSGLILLQES